MKHTQDTQGAAHTPGPWHAYNRNGSRVFKAWRVYSDCGEQPCGVCQMDESLTGDQQVANAYLVAAAPDLLAACEESLVAVEALIDRLRAERMESGRIHAECVLAGLKSAIAKAKGTQ